MEMEGWVSSGGGRVMPETIGTGGHSGNRQNGLGLLPKDSSQPGPWQGKTPSPPGRSPSRCGGRASEQGAGDSGSRECGQGGRVHCSAESPGRTSCRQTSTGFRFLVQAVYDALPSPANLHVWGKSETPSCLLCSGRGSLEHLLSRLPKGSG